MNFSPNPNGLTTITDSQPPPTIFFHSFFIVSFFIFTIYTVIWLYQKRQREEKRRRERESEMRRTCPYAQTISRPPVALCTPHNGPPTHKSQCVGNTKQKTKQNKNEHGWPIYTLLRTLYLSLPILCFCLLSRTFLLYVIHTYVST